jgi:OmcA/MtrC family decaheme c-type cytochrome
VHTIPAKSKQLVGLKLEITGVTGTNPGDKPTVSFKVSDGKGSPVDATKLDSLGFVLAGPTDDYTFVTRNATTGVAATENGLTAKPTSTGFTYTFSTALPKDAKGTFAVGTQGYRLVTLSGPLAGQSFNVREFFSNPVFYFGVSGAKVVQRRKVVDTENCNVCHKQIALHGAARTNATEYCEMCHNPKSLDTQTPGQTVNFRTHIHRIHRGEELGTDWTINGTNNYNGVRFPGDLRNCAKCHVNNSNQLPLPDGLADADTPRLFYTPTKPTASACLGCHDEEDAAAHAYQMTAPFGESCGVCHEEGKDFAVSKVHAR